MSPRRSALPGTLLDLWRPPSDAGNAIGCLATTFTFQPAVFDEHCLARFLDIESEPDREDLAFLLDREHQLGTTYAGVIVDHTQSGVEHSFRWDVLPARIPRGKQHAKLSLLAWERLIRVIVASANLTEQGYRSNQEVVGHLDFTPESSRLETLNEATQFLRRLLQFVPGPAESPSVDRAAKFLNDVDRRARRWPTPRRALTSQHLVFTTPAAGPGRAKRSSLDEALQICRSKGGAPDTAWVASPFFDDDHGAAELTEVLCGGMARGSRELCVAVPVLRDEPTGMVRVLAPETLLTTPERHRADVTIEMLPEKDSDKNVRVWHAKMLGFRHADYSALMIGSSNFTLAGMGHGDRQNVEANLLTVVRYERFARDEAQLESIWPPMTPLPNSEKVEWCGARADNEEEEQASTLAVPPGFLSAVYRAGDQRFIILHFDPVKLPPRWTIRGSGRNQQVIVDSRAWSQGGSPPTVEVAWSPAQPPERLLVQWEKHEAFMPLNVEDIAELPPPVQVENMTADDVLGIIAASDPGAAIRAWAKTQRQSEDEDDELDSALPIDLDPLRRYDLHATFLHRIRRRARVLAQLRVNLQRPVPSQQALEWRLRGMVGVEVLADRMLRDLVDATTECGEALLGLVDLLIVLHEVDYSADQPGALKKEEFDKTYRRFLTSLVDDLREKVRAHRERVPDDLWPFWQRITTRGPA